MSDLQAAFEQLDRLPGDQGYRIAASSAPAVVEFLDSVARKVATISGQENGYAKALGALGQLWKDPNLPFPQKPSSLGQVLVLGGLGSLLGYGGGKLVNSVISRDIVKADRLGAMLGGVLGASPGVFSAIANYHQGKPVWSSSFYQTKESSFGSDPYACLPINVHRAHEFLWHDPLATSQIPAPIRAGASGLLHSAANLPDKPRNSPFVTPFDVARAAVGMGSGLASGWVVGKAMGALFGTSPKVQRLLRNTGAAVGTLKAIVPVAFGNDFP